MFNNFVGLEYPESTLAALAGTAIEALEYMCVDSAPRFHDRAHLARFSAIARDCRLRVWSVHAPFDGADISRPDEVARRAAVESVIHALDAASELGAGIVVVHASGEPIADDEREARLVQLVRSLNELCKRASQQGVQLALETLPRTCLANRVAEIRRILDIVDGALGVCYDVNHVTLYEEVGGSLRGLADRIVTCHISDHDGVDERHWIPGRGMVDWAGFAAGLDEMGYTGCLIHEASDGELDIPGNLAAIAAAAPTCLGWVPLGAG